jgi:diguanylate cyclase (GGDEF)-like protein
MMLPKPLILIIHTPRRASEYITALEKTGAKVQAVASFEEANEQLSFLHPDLILLSADLSDGEGRLYCQQIRATLTQPRPILVLMESSIDVNDRIRSFRYGADDVLNEPIDNNELAFRVLAHLRRRQEELSSALTHLPGSNFIRQMLEQCLVGDHNWSVLSIDLDNLRVYNETYGDLAGDQLIKALGAIVQETATESEFAGHIDSDDFLMVTQQGQAEELAKKICSQFETISKRFYPPEDVSRGYLVATGHSGIRRRVPLISVSIGIVPSSSRRFHGYVDILTTARDFRYMAKQLPGNTWILGNNKALTPKKTDLRHRSILVVEPDGAMACLLQEALALEGYQVQVTNSSTDALALVSLDPPPDLILLESSLAEKDMDGWSLCRSLKQNTALKSIRIVMATADSDQSAALEAGADLYLPKPFDIPALLSEISVLLSSNFH